jgi:hypothetical protein
MPFYLVDNSTQNFKDLWLCPISSKFEGDDDVMELPDELYARWRSARAELIEVECEIHKIQELNKRSVEVH